MSIRHCLRALCCALALLATSTLMLPGGVSADEAMPMFKATPQLSVEPAAAVWPVSGGGAENTCYTPLNMPSSPSILWQAKISGMSFFHGSPAVDGKHRIFACTNSDYKTEGTLTCCSISGGILWQQRLDAHTEQHPVVMRSGKILEFDAAAHLHAFNPEDGTPLWQQNYRIKEYNMLQPVPDPAGGCLLADDTPALFSLADDGSLRWSVASTTGSIGGIGLAGDNVWVSTSGGWLYCFSKQNGALLSSRQTGWEALGHFSCPAGSSYIYGSCWKAGIAMLGFNSNGPDFSYSFGSNFFESGQTLCPGSLVYALTTMTYDKGPVASLHGFDLDGSELWSFILPAEPANEVICDPSGRLFYGSDYAGFPGAYCIDPATQQVAWYVPLKYGSTAFPVDEGRLGLFESSPDKTCTLLLIGADPAKRPILAPGDRTR